MSPKATEFQRLNALRAKAQRYADSSDSPHVRRVCRAIMVELNDMLHAKLRHVGKRDAA